MFEDRISDAWRKSTIADRWASTRWTSGLSRCPVTIAVYVSCGVDPLPVIPSSPPQWFCWVGSKPRVLPSWVDRQCQRVRSAAAPSSCHSPPGCPLGVGARAAEESPPRRCIQSGEILRVHAQWIVNAKLSGWQRPPPSVILRPQPKNLPRVAATERGRSLAAARDDRMRGRLPAGHVGTDDPLRMTGRGIGCQPDSVALSTHST